MRDAIQIAEDEKKDKIRYIKRSIPEVPWDQRGSDQLVSHLMSKEEADNLAERVNSKEIGTFLVVASRQPESKGQYRVLVNTKAVSIKELDIDEKLLIIAFLNEVYGSYVSSFRFIDTQWKLSHVNHEIVYVGPSAEHKSLFLNEGINIKAFVLGQSERKTEHSCRAEVIKLAQDYLIQESSIHGAAYFWTKSGILALNEIRERYQSENTAGLSVSTNTASTRRYGEFFTGADTAAEIGSNFASSSNTSNDVKTETPSFS